MRKNLQLIVLIRKNRIVSQQNSFVKNQKNVPKDVMEKLNVIMVKMRSIVLISIMNADHMESMYIVNHPIIKALTVFQINGPVTDRLIVIHMGMMSQKTYVVRNMIIPANLGYFVIANVLSCRKYVMGILIVLMVGMNSSVIYALMKHNLLA